MSAALQEPGDINEFQGSRSPKVLHVVTTASCPSSRDETAAA